MRGGQWALGGYALNSFLALASSAVLARILFPSTFGLFALATTIVGAAYAVGDIGLGATLIARRDIDELHERAIHGALILMGFVLGLTTSGVSLVLWLFGDARLSLVVLALSAVLALSGPSWFFVALQRKDFEFRLQFICTATQSFVLAGVSIGAALVGAGVYAFAAGQIAGLAALTAAQVIGARRRAMPPPAPTGLVRRTAAQAIAARRRVVPLFAPRPMRSVAAMGRGFFAQGLFGFVAQNSDNVSVAISVGNRGLGLYASAYRFASLPYLGITEPVAQAMFPRLSKAYLDGRDVLRQFLPVLTFVSLLAGPAAAVCIGSPRALLGCVLGPRWTDATTALAILGVWSAVRPIQGLVGWLLNAVGAQGAMARVAGITLFVTIPALLAAAHFGGIAAVAAVMATDIFLSYVFLLYLVRTRLSTSVLPLVSISVTTWIACLVAAAAAHGIASVLSSGGYLESFAGASVTAVVTYLLAWCAIRWRSVRALGAVLRASGTRGVLTFAISELGFGSV